MLSHATFTRKTPLPLNSLGVSGNHNRRTLAGAGSSRALSFGYKNGSLNCGPLNWSGRSGTGFGHLGRVSSVSGGSSGGSGGIGGSGGGDSSGGGGEDSGGNGNKWSFLSWYLALLSNYPVLTKAVTSAILTLPRELSLSPATLSTLGASTMACPSLLQSSASTFHGRFPSLAVPSSARVLTPSLRNVVRVSASGTVLVEKSESEKVQRLKTAYLERIIPALKDEFKYINIHQVPKVQKIVVNCGIGDAAQNDKGLEAAMKDIALITGQKPVKTRARASIATFKIREDQPLGIAVTLRGDVMYSFLDRLINLALPRTRDFQGVSPSSFDGNGNYSIGVKDQSVFPEIRFDAIGKARGMDVCISTTAKTDQEGQKLLALMGMPFREGSGGVSTGLPMRKKKLKAHHFDAKGKGKGKR